MKHKTLQHIQTYAYTKMFNYHFLVGECISAIEYHLSLVLFDGHLHDALIFNKYNLIFFRTTPLTVGASPYSLPPEKIYLQIRDLFFIIIKTVMPR